MVKEEIKESYDSADTLSELDDDTQVAAVSVVVEKTATPKKETPARQQRQTPSKQTPSRQNPRTPRTPGTRTEEPTPTMGRKVVNRPAKRHLVRWTDDMDNSLLLTVQSACNIDGIAIPWDKVGSMMGEHITGGAVIQHLAKLRTRCEKAGVQVPPPLRRGGTTRLSTSASSTPKRTPKTNIPKTPGSGKKRAKSASTEISDDDSDGEYGKPRVTRSKSGRKKAKTLKDNEDTDSDDEESKEVAEDKSIIKEEDSYVGAGASFTMLQDDEDDDPDDTEDDGTEDRVDDGGKPALTGNDEDVGDDDVDDIEREEDVVAKPENAMQAVPARTTPSSGLVTLKMNPSLLSTAFPKTSMAQALTYGNQADPTSGYGQMSTWSQPTDGGNIASLPYGLQNNIGTNSNMLGYGQQNFPLNFNQTIFPGPFQPGYQANLNGGLDWNQTSSYNPVFDASATFDLGQNTMMHQPALNNLGDSLYGQFAATSTSAPAGGEANQQSLGISAWTNSNTTGSNLNVPTAQTAEVNHKPDSTVFTSNGMGQVMWSAADPDAHLEKGFTVRQNGEGQYTKMRKSVFDIFSAPHPGDVACGEDKDQW